MNCIDLAVTASKGMLTRQEVLDAFESHNKIREALIASGKTDNLDARVASQIERQALAKKTEAARMKRQVIQTIKVRTRLEAKIKELRKKGGTHANAIIATWQSVQGNFTGGRGGGYQQGKGIEARWAGGIMDQVVRERPHVEKLFADKAFDSDVTRELFELRDGGKPGSTGNSDAQWFAKTLAAHMEMHRTELNRFGAAIGKLEGYAGPQMHDDIAMSKVGVATWREFIGVLLDVEKSFPDVTDPKEMAEILDGIYHTIITGVSKDASPLLTGQRVGPANLATRLGSRRVLHFRDADAAMQYRDKFGRGSTIQGIFGQMRHQAQMAGAMDTYGANPKAMILSLAAKAQNDLRAEVEKLPPGKQRDKLQKEIDQLAAADGEVASLEATIDDVTGLSSRPENITWARIGQSIRNQQAISKLGGATLTAVPTDTVTMASAAMFRNGGFFKGLAHTFSELANRNNGREIAYVQGEGFASIIGHLASVHDTPGRMSRWTNLFFRMSGLSGWTDIARGAQSRMIAAELGMNVGKTYDTLPGNLAYVLKLNGIDGPKWDAMRSVGVREINGNVYLTPDRIRHASDTVIEPIVADKIAEMRAVMLKPTKAGNVTDAMQTKFDAKRAQIIADARREVEMDLYRYYADETSYGVIETDAASRRIATGGLWGSSYRPGTLAGESMRALMQFKGFPIAFTQRVLGRAIRNAPAGRQAQAMHIGTTLAGLTVAGYMSLTLKDIALGKWPPRNPLDWRTWVASATQGGAIGIYGDFVFGEVNRYGNSPWATFGGPMVGNAEDLTKLAYSFYHLDPSFGQTLNFVVNNTPFANLFYVRPALDLIWVNSLREAAKPGYLKRQETTLRKERGQHYVLPRTLEQAMK